MLKFLFSQRWRQVKRFIARANIGQTATAFLLIVVCGLVAFGVYELLASGFAAVSENDFLQSALPFLVYEMFLLVVSGLVFYSVLITGTFGLFQSKQDFWIIESPSFLGLIFDKFISVTTLSLWPLLVLAFPALLAVESVFLIGMGGVIIGAAVILLLAILSSILAFIVLFLAAQLIWYLQQRFQVGNFRWFVTCIAGFIAITFIGLWSYFRGVDIYGLVSVTDLEIVEAGVTEIAMLFRYFPSHLAALTLQGLQVGNFSAALSASFSLLAMSALSLALLSVFKNEYISVWKLFQEGETQPRLDNRERKNKLQFSGGATRSIIKREWLAFIRSTKNRLWALFLLGLWLVTVVFDPFMRTEIGGEEFLGLGGIEFIQVFQFLVVVYFVAALSVRFIFPNFSLESDAAWSLISSPVSLVRLFWAKAAFFALATGLITLTVALIHVVLLQLEVLSAALFVMMAIVAAVTVSVLGLAIGARFPNFQASDPERLSTTLPGLSFVLLSLLYGSAASYAMYSTFLTGDIFTVIFFVIGSIFLGYGFCRLATAKLPTIEFERETQS